MKIACTSNYITSTLRVLTLGSESDGSCKDLLVQKSVRLIVTRYVNYGVQKKERKKRVNVKGGDQ